MGYLICKSCGGRYDLQPGELPGDFESCQCGGELDFYDDRGHKRWYMPVYSGKRNGSKMHPLFKILIIFVLGILLFDLGVGPAMAFLLYGLQYLGPSGGTILFGIFFGITIAAILGLLWYLIKRR